MLNFCRLSNCDSMQYRTKLLLFFVGLAIVSNSAIALLLYYRNYHNLFDQISSKVLSIAATAAQSVDGDRHERVQTEADMEGEDYKLLVEQFRQFRDANRREDIEVKFIYSMRPDKSDSKLYRFVIDAEELLEDKALVNEIYRPTGEYEEYSLNEPQVQSKFMTDQWGTWLTATAPIRDSSGKGVAVLGVDVAADNVVAELRKILYISIGSLVASIGLAAALALFLANKAAKPLHAIRETLEQVATGNYGVEVKVDSKDEFGLVAESLNKMILGLQQRENLKGALARYVSQEVTDSVLNTGAAAVRSERKKITILFADVRGFTSLSEKITPEEMVELLNTYLEKMIDSIFNHKGYLNKFMGDGLMAVFGAERDDPYQEENAILAALDMRKALDELRQKWRAEGRIDRVQDLHIGIGINTGVAIVGNIGSSRRMEFGVIGDSVNLASRLESATKEMNNVDMLVSEYTYVAVRSRFAFRSCGDIRVKGKADPIMTYTVDSNG